jgi:hypothetical protein
VRVIAAAIVATVAVLPLQDAPSSGCAGSSAWTYCDVDNSGSSVDVSAGEVGEGIAGVPDIHEGRGSNSPSTPPPPEDCGPLNRCIDYTVVDFPEVTLADLASFRPATPTLGGEPAGFGVVGMPTNLLAAASEERIPGTVLGWDVTVRFVPTAYVFDNGDGTTTRAATGGSAWASLGQGQFTPTETSHAYRARGTYGVSVTVEYAASVDFGTGWRPVPGVVRAEAGGYDLRVVEVRTALVDRTCAEDPTGPGC